METRAPKKNQEAMVSPPAGTEEDERSIGDLHGTTLNDVDCLMDKVIGDHVHQNYGTHLDDGIADDTTWQHHCIRLVVFPGQM
jgi:hypothetical protein